MAAAATGNRKYTRDPVIQVGQIHVEGVNFVGSRTTLYPGETVHLWIDAPEDYDSWTDGTESGEELDNSLYGVWSQGGGAYSTASGFSTTWTAPSTLGTYVPKLTVNDDPTYGSRNGRNDLLVERTVTLRVVNVTVGSLQHAKVGAAFQDVNGQNILVPHKQTWSFKALPNPAGSTFPDGKPTWGGAAVGTGETNYVFFNTASSSQSDVKSVTATAGGVTRTANAVVFSTNISRNEEWSAENSARPQDGTPVGGPQLLGQIQPNGSVTPFYLTVVELQVNITPSGLNLLPSQSSRFGFHQTWESSLDLDVEGIGTVNIESLSVTDPDEFDMDKDGQGTGDTYFAFDSPGIAVYRVQHEFDADSRVKKVTFRQDFTAYATYDGDTFGEPLTWTAIVIATKNDDGTISWSGDR